MCVGVCVSQFVMVVCDDGDTKLCKALHGACCCNGCRHNPLQMETPHVDQDV